MDSNLKLDDVIDTFAQQITQKREYKFSLKVKLLKLGIGCFVLVQYTIKGTKKGQKI